jgi:hypothetical protein
MSLFRDSTLADVLPSCLPTFRGEVVSLLADDRVGSTRD